MADKYYIGTDGDWSDSANWSPSGVPVDTDDVFIDNNSTSITDGLDQSAVTLATLNIGMGFTGLIGTTSAYLQIGATISNIGLPGVTNQSGSAMIKLNYGSVQNTTNIFNSATAGISGREPILLIGTNAANACYVLKGIVGIARVQETEVATFPIIAIGTNKEGNGGKVNIGQGTTLGSVRIGSGTVTNFGATMAGTGKELILTDSSATYIVYGTPAHTSIDCKAGAVKYNSNGTITGLVVGGSGSIDFSADPRTKAVTNCQVTKGSKINADNGTPLGVVFTNGIDYLCELSEATIDVGSSFTATFSAI